ncbi:lipoprotein [Actinotalea ferrariae CF5-4]|uniref:Lipoprotein n=1 Tax=Actinotalea ferrariae CF5-4 TaxID=948458 RepID=A0A021VUV3_9CELL|nr:hypothetical protein [Actinotalea ferrariae]EYR63840.1 lipoprotein [Actinotalea ferrariae CF5-4]
MTTHRATHRETRRATRTGRLAAGTLLAASALITGCSATNPITTDIAYPPSHGLPVDISETAGLVNLMVLTAEEGGTGALYGAAWNNNTVPVDVTVALPDGTVLGTVAVPAGGTVTLGSAQEEQVRVPDVPVPPGAVMELVVGTDRGGQVTAAVPVLDGTLPPYDPLVPVAPSDRDGAAQS